MGYFILARRSIYW